MGTNDVLGGLSWLLLSPPALDGHKSYNVIVMFPVRMCSIAPPLMFTKTS